MTAISQNTTVDMKKVGLLGFAALLVVACFALIPDIAHAGAGGTAFDDVWLWLKDNIQGTLGRIIVGAMIIVGIIGGVAKQSLIAFAIGVGGGIGLYNTPLVLENMVSATVVHAQTLGTAAQLLTNGL